MPNRLRCPFPIGKEKKILGYYDGAAAESFFQDEEPTA